jgi:uncharacterized protein (TIGR02099 family)
VKAFLKSIAKRVSVLAIIFIITIAIGISLSPLISKALNDRRPVFEKWVSTYLGIPVTMGEVGFSWYRYYPEISLKKITIYNQASNKPAIQIQKVSVFFSVPKSIWQRKLVPSGFMVVGTHLNLKKTEAGNMTVLGLEQSSDLKSSNGAFVGALAFISTQPYLILEDIGLNYEDPKGTMYHALLKDLKIVNSNMRHRLSGSLELYQKVPTGLTWSLEWRGKKFDLSAIKAKGYVYVTGLSLPQWLSGHEWQGWQINKGIASAKIWGTLSRGRVRKLQSSLKLYDLDLYSKLSKTSQQIHRFSGNIGWKRERKQYVLAGEDILIDLPSRLWPVTDFYVAFAREKNHELAPKLAHIGYINLNDVVPFLKASPTFVPDHIQQMLSALHLRGSLQNTSIKFGEAWKNWQQLDFNTHFNQLSFSSWQDFPSIKNFSGSLKWDGAFGELSLNSSRSLFQYGPIFSNPINIEQLIGKIQFQKDQNQTWKLNVPSLQLLNNDISANMSGGLTLPLVGPKIADIKANFVLQKAEHVSRYLPLKNFSPYLVKWLQEAFLSGEVKDGHLELRGALNEFPFDHQNGTFLITSKVNNIALHYAERWPDISKLSGKLTFSGKKILMDINHGEINNIPLTKVHGEIPSLWGETPPVLSVESKNIQTDFAKGLKFIHESPLNQTIGKMFAKTDLTGPIDLDLSLKVPLSGTTKTEVKGTLGLKDATLKLPEWHINLDELNGKVIFTEQSTDAKMMKGSLFNKPITFSLATINKTKDISIVRASFQNRINIDDLEKWSKIPFSTVVSGAASVSGYIDFSQKLPVSMYLQSNLVGLKVNLPDQYSKDAKSPKPFTADLTFPETSPWKIHVTYGDLLSASALLQKNTSHYRLIGVNLHFGTGLADLPKEDGLYISGKFNKLEWDNVKKYIDQANTNDKNSKDNEENQNKNDLSALAFRNADIMAETLNVFGQEIKQVHLQATSEDNNWNINIASPDIVGQLMVPKQLTQHSTITAQFQKLYLSKGASNQTNKIDIKSLPSISFKADDMKYNDMPFGKVSFNALSNGSKMEIQSLRIVSPRINLQAEGDWSLKGDGTQTHLKGSARSDRVSELLGSLGLDAHNFVSTEGKLEFNLTWEDTPFLPSLSHLAGEAKINLGGGRIVNVSQSRAQMSVGRMLSIFSMQSIPKRLSLDFSDLFQKGYNFNSASGDFTFENGNAFTKNLRFDGPVASVGIDGRIGLINKDYNLVLNTKTYVTSSLPVVAAATLLSGINPLIGLGALAVNTVIGPEMTTYYYSVTGPWSNPVWQKVR